jgi:hypothetical protein
VSFEALDAPGTRNTKQRIKNNPINLDFFNMCPPFYRMGQGTETGFFV